MAAQKKGASGAKKTAGKRRANGRTKEQGQRDLATLLSAAISDPKISRALGASDSAEVDKVFATLGVEPERRAVARALLAGLDYDVLNALAVSFSSELKIQIN